jgi:uncharacterized protein YkwD
MRVVHERTIHDAPQHRAIAPAGSCALFTLLALVPGVVLADMLSAINHVRADCGAPTALSENPHLTEIARLRSLGATLAVAQKQAGYHAAHIVSMQLPGVPDERSLGRMLKEQMCARLITPGVRELGAVRRGADVWIALGEPFIPPDPDAAASISQRVLELTNEARAQARRCGSTQVPAAPPVSLDPVLEKVAREHSQDMATHGFMEHRGTDGSLPADRMTRAGYVWRMFGENVASGDATAESVVAGWLASPDHCRVIMGAGYQHMGVAFAVNLDTDGRVYWTQEFGTPSAEAHAAE